MNPVLKPVVVYLPDSQDKDAQRHGAELEMFLSSKGWCDVVVVKDPADFDDFLSRIQAGEFSVLVVWSLASLARSWRDLIVVLAALVGNSIGLVTLMDRIDTTNTTKDSSFQILVHALNQFQVDLRRLKIREGIERAKKQGKIIGRRPRLPIDEVHRLRYLGLTMEDVGRRLGGTKSAVSKILSKYPQPAHLPRPIKLKDITSWMPMA